MPRARNFRVGIRRESAATRVRGSSGLIAADASVAAIVDVDGLTVAAVATADVVDSTVEAEAAADTIVDTTWDMPHSGGLN